MRSTNDALRALIVVAAVDAAACQDEVLQRLVPAISVCPAADVDTGGAGDDGGLQALVPAAPERCDRALDLGSLPVTVATALPLFVVNRGDATLHLDAVSADAPSVGVESFPDHVARGLADVVSVTITPPADALGPQVAVLTFVSDDPARGHHDLQLHYTGVPRPVPDVVLCVDGVCGPSATIDFGDVRRTREEGRVVIVKNVGDVALHLAGARLVEASSLGGEFQLLSSTSPGALEPGASATLALSYEPGDGGADTAELWIDSDDPDTPAALVTLAGASPGNLPPVAVAVDEASGTADVVVRVGDVLSLDGTGSTDPEGDRLAYAWTLTPPSGGSATLDDPSATRARFSPERAGTWRASLVVTDSLGQSSLAAVVLYDVRPRYRFRAELSWNSRQDLDLHLVDLALADGTSGALFSPGDCGGEVRSLDLGDPDDALDDCVLFDDAVSGPATEAVVVEEPADGTYAIWVHVFDDGGLPGAVATVALRLDDGDPVQLLTQTLPATCAAWHVADVTFPAGTFSSLSEPLAEVCR